jgi:hypothetical protein
VYKLDSFVGFIGDEQLHAQECYGLVVAPKGDLTKPCVILLDKGAPLAA